MKKGLTEIVFILDRSGSMSGLEKDTIGGYNSLINKQQKNDGEALLTTVLFDDQYEVLHNRVDIQDVTPLTNHHYYARGMTALYDAIGKTINFIKIEHELLDNELQPEHTMVVITTDGMENCSREFTTKTVRNLVETQKAEQNWEFIFLGANIDAISTAAKFGIDKDRATNFHADDMGIKKNYESINNAIHTMRSEKKVNKSWKKTIEDDYEDRKGKM